MHALYTEAHFALAAGGEDAEEMSLLGGEMSKKMLHSQ